MQRRRGREILVAGATALVLLAPVSATAGEWQTYLHEDFSSAQTMFYTGPLGTAYYGIDESGRYVVDGLTAPGDSMAILTDSLYYYYFETECEVLDTLAGDLASCGLVFHYNKRVRPGQNSYYVFYVYSDGYYGVKRVVGDSDGNVDILIPLAKTEMIDANYPNVLAVDAQGSRFDLYINGKYVDGFTDLTIDGGGFGFYATKNTKAAYDNFSVKIERRELGRDNLAQPTVNSGESTESGFSYLGYSPPVIPKDPNRPFYPWEVGYVDPDDTKQTADKPVVEPLPLESATSTSNGTTPAEIVVGQTPRAANQHPPPAPKDNPSQPASQTPPVEAGAESGSPATEGGVVTHSYGEFGDYGNSSEVKLVPADELEEPASPVSEPDREPEAPVFAPVNREDPAPIEEAELPMVDTPKVDIRPDWLLENEPVKSPGSEGEIEDKENITDSLDDGEPLSRTPDVPPVPTEESKPADIEDPENQDVSEQRKEKPIHRRSSGIGGNDKYWDEDPVDSRDYKKEKQPEQAIKLVTDNETEPAANDFVPKIPEHNGDDPSEDNENNSDQLSLFPTSEEITQLEQASAVRIQPIEAPPAQDLDTPEVINLPEGPLDREKVDILSFREASTDAPPTKETAGEITLDGQPKTNSPGPESGPEIPIELADPLPTETPAVETEIVISTLPGPVLPPILEEPTSQAAPVDISTPEQQYIDNPIETPIELENTLPLFAPVTPDEAALGRPEQQPQITIIDDFSEQTWPIGDNGISSYRYFGAAYEIDNRMADTMAISFQQNKLARAQYTVESEFLDGISDVGYGLAAHFQVNGGNASYYGLFVSHSGEYLLLKVVGGKEEVLVDWMPCNLLKPTMPNIISLEIASPSIKVFINGKLITTVLDSSLRSGGYALLAGPGVAARFDNLVVNGDPLN